MEVNKIYQGDCLEVLKTFPDKSINCCMTSPPYWALRDYGVDGQLGLEPTFQQYINKLCDIFDEVKRVLRKDGTLWVNIGDTYGQNFRGSNKNNCSKIQLGNKGTIDFMGKSAYNTNFPNKSLCNIPARFSIEMQNRGWILRNVIIWHKPNCMPSSVKDRFTVDFEYLYFFVKSKKYWFETQYEPQKTFFEDKSPPIGSKKLSGGFNPTYSGNQPPSNPLGRNKRAVWTITTKPFKEAHFATYPEALCETPIKAGCPEFVCNKCGKIKEVKEVKEVIHNRVNNRKDAKVRPDNFERIPNDWKPREIKEIKEISCNCNAGFSGGVVLDPFCGAGTTGLVALKQNKQFIGIELNPEYIKIAEKRLEMFK
jgi:DNA modification methylase